MHQSSGINKSLCVWALHVSQGLLFWLIWLSLWFLTATQPLPHPFLLPCCLPEPLPVPRALHGPFSVISTPARPGVNLRELGELSLNARWLHKSPAGWDVNHYVSRSLYEGAKQTQLRDEEKAAGRRLEWQRENKLQQMDCFPSSNLSNTSFFVCCLSLLYNSLLFTTCGLKCTDFVGYLFSWTMLSSSSSFFYFLFCIEIFMNPAFLLSALHATVGGMHL